MFISNAYAQTAGGPAGLGMFDFALPIVMLLVVWLLIFRPQMKKQKEHAKLVKEIGVGAEVVTNSGIAGKITKVGDNFFTVEVAKGVEIQVQRQAIANELPTGTLKKA